MGTDRLVVTQGPEVRRRDAWWLQVAAVVAGLSAFGLYARYGPSKARIFQWGPYLSPFYSPLIDVHHRYWPFFPGTAHSGRSLSFRVTCYYYRKAYYARSFFDPPACAISERKGRAYGGETKFPFILQNLHRYCCTWQAIFIAFLWARRGQEAFFRRRIQASAWAPWCSQSTWRCSPCICFRATRCASAWRQGGSRSLLRIGSARRAIRFGGNLTSLNEHICCFAWMSLFSGLCRFVRAAWWRAAPSATENLVSEKYETHEHAVLIIGAGGAGLSAAIAALAMAWRVGVVCKSLLGKAQTVMAEGGIAAASAQWTWPTTGKRTSATLCGAANC